MAWEREELFDRWKEVLLAVETPSLGSTLSPNLINGDDEINTMKLLGIKSGPDSLTSRPLVRQGGVKRKLVRAISTTDPSRNIDIVLETKLGPIPSNPDEKRASIRRTKVDNIKRAAVCSLYLQQREKSYTSPTPESPKPTIFTPNIPLITTTTASRKLSDEFNIDDTFDDLPLSRSRSFAPNRRIKRKEASRTNSCLARYICLPDMTVRDEIQWARRSLKLYREFSHLSADNRTDSFLNLDLFFSDDFDKESNIFKMVEEEEEEAALEEEEEGEEGNNAFDYLYSLSSLYRTTCPYKRFGDSKLKFPFDVCCNENGDVFVSDWEAGIIYQLENIEDELQDTLKFPHAFGMCVVGNDLYVTSEENEHLYLRKADSPIQQDLGFFPSPDGICYLNGYIYVVEEQNNRIRGLTNCGDFVLTFGDNNGEFTLNKPGGLSVYPEKELLVVCDRGNKRISLWDRLGNPIDTIPLTQHPDCCAYAGHGILVVGTSEGEVLFIDLDCKHHVFTWTNKQLKHPGFITGVAVDNRQNVYICDPKNHRVIKVFK